MKRVPFDLGDGTVHVLAPGEDVAALRPSLRGAIPPRMAAAWIDVPATLAGWAARSPSAPFAAWLADAARARRALEVYETTDFPLRAFLAFDFGVRQTAGGLLPWRVLVDVLGDDAGGGAPEPLATVLGTIGGLCTQWGASGTLVSPVDRSTRRGWTTFWENDGDELAHDGAGNARWTGHEWGDPSSLPPLTVAECVDDLFVTLRAKTYFSMAEQATLRSRAPARA